jgi:hypothetical protein
VESISLFFSDLSRQAAGDQEFSEAKKGGEAIRQTLLPNRSTRRCGIKSHWFLVGIRHGYVDRDLWAFGERYVVFTFTNLILAWSGLFDSADQPAEQVEHAALVCLDFASHNPKRFVKS